ncbi:MAG: hypothetical protein KDB53_06520 [Planctomycetes bacterium]|nr:hypothetical protein [Planctomycetota bacterium]
MKVRTTLAVAALFLVMGFLGSRLFPIDDPTNTNRTLSIDFERNLLRVQERLDAIEEQIRAQRASGVKDQSLEVAANRREIQRLREQIEDMTSGTGVLSPTKADPDQARWPEAAEDLAAMVEEQVRRIDEERAQDKRAIAREKAREWVTQTTRAQAKKLGTTLRLSEVQVERLATGLDETLADNLPRYEVLKADDQSNEARLAAIEGLRASWRTLDDKARNELSSTQFQGFLETQNPERAKMEGWFTTIEDQIRNVDPGRR